MPLSATEWFWMLGCEEHINLRFKHLTQFTQVARAEDRKAVGVVIFTDPADHTNAGEEYPRGWMLNRYGVQRGTINRLPGDALSIGYPSKG